MKKIVSLALSLLLCVTSVPIQMTSFAVEENFDDFAGGNGTKENPYKVANTYHLRRLAELVNNAETADDYNSCYYVQTEDIDLTGLDFIPIGTYTVSEYSGGFCGSYNGNYKKVYGLHVSQEPTNGGIGNYNGLFGWIYNGKVENLSVYGEINCPNSGICGGIVGEIGSSTEIVNCSFSGQVTGNYLTGGVVGHSWLGGTIKNCYFNGNVSCTSENANGGIIGGITAGTEEKPSSVTVENCYAVGTLEGAASAGIVGSVTNKNDNSVISIQNNYYLSSMSQMGINGDVKTGCESMGFDFMKNIDELLGNPFVHNDSAELNDGYPVFEWQSIPYQFKGSGTADDPYQISSKEELEKMRDLVNSPFFGENQYNTKYYIQTADIDLKNEQWIPIGKDMKDGVQGGLPPFRGHYNGNHHFIKNLYVNENDKFAGLFGSLNSGGVIENLEVYGNVKSTGNSVGGVLGELGSANGVVRNCCFFGNVESSEDAVGGVVGYLWVCGTIENCYHNGSVTNTADEPVGGIVGHIYSGRHESYNAYVKNCYHVGKVSGRDAVTGSILGFSEEYDDTEGKTFISNCYSIKGDAPANGNGSYTATDMNELSENMLKNNAVSKLGSPFIKNSNNDFNSGYPVFWWQLSGDTNFDGKLSVTDVVAVQKWLHKQGSLSEWQNVDFNGDGKVNVVDLCLMKKKLLGK